NILIALPGLHRYNRGAEVALIAVARELSLLGNKVTLVGSGHPRDSEPYTFIRASSVRREYFERFPSIPMLRNEYAYEELTFLPGLLWAYDPTQFDVTLACSYPFTNWALRRPVRAKSRPSHIFITE